jgi:hypothetical protein
MTTTYEKLSELQLYINREEQLLICCRTECGYTLSVEYSQVMSHLRDKYNIVADLRRGITYILKHEYTSFFPNPMEVAERDDSAVIYAKLHLYKGFACREYNYNTINYPELSRYISKEYLNSRQVSRSRLNDYYNNVYL